MSRVRRLDDGEEVGRNIEVELRGDDVLVTLFDSSPIAMALLDRRGRPRRANSRLQLLLGLTEAELRATTLAQLSHPGDAAGEVACFEELVARDRDDYQLHKRYLHKNGDVVWVRQTVTRRETTSGALFVATLEDVTAARRTEERLRTLVHALGERVKELTALHHTAHLLLQSSGTRQEQLQRVADLLPPALMYPESATGCVRFGGEVYLAGPHERTPWTLSAPFRAGDGTEGVVEVAYREARPEEVSGPFLAEEVSLLSSLAEMIRASIDRQEASRALTEAHERMSFAFEAAGMGIWEWDVTRNMVRWSANLSRILGIPGDTFGPFGEHRGRIHEADREVVFSRLSRAAEGDDQLQGLELRMLGADGSWRHLEAKALILREPPARATRIIVAMIDVTERGAAVGG